MVLAEMITETTFGHAVVGSSRFFCKGFSTSLTMFRNALVDYSSCSVSSIRKGGDNLSVKSLSGGHGHEEETDRLKFVY